MVSPVNALTGVVLALGGVVGLSVAYVALRHRDHPAARPLAGIAALPGVAGLCFAALTVVPDSPATLPLLAFANVLLTVTVGYFLLFTLAYTGRGSWLTPRRRWSVIGLYVLSGVVFAVHMLGLPVSVETIHGLTYPVVANRNEGLPFAVTFAIAYAAILAGLLVLVRFLISSRNMYRKQTALILGAIGLTVVGSVVYESGVRFHPGLTLTAVFYSVEAVLIALALFRYEFLNVEPLAPDVVLERIDDPVVVLDDSDAIVDTNPAARLLVGSSDLVGTQVTDLLPGLLGAAAKDEEYAPPGSDESGTIEVYDLNAAPITDQYDRDRGTVVVLRDVSLQKRRERTLERLQSVSQRCLAAETAEEVLDIAVTAADELLEYPYSGAMRYDEDDDVLRPAAFADALTGAFDGVSTEAIFVEPGETDVGEVFESGEPMLGDPIDIEDGALGIDIGGSLLYPLGDHGVLGISAGPDHEGFTDDDRRFADILVSTTENALDRVEKERQLRESRELLAARNEQIGFFNSVLRHDLLNGMQVVQGHLDLLEEQVDGEAGDHVRVVDDWIADIVTLTQNVRAVTTAIGDDGDVDLKPVDLGAALSEKVAKIRDGHDRVTVDSIADLDGLPAVQADDFLPEVFENLLGNAVEHSDREDTEILVDATVGTSAVTVRIADNGPGIDDEAKEAIFEESVTSEGSGSVGFGLYFARVMVERYGGSIWFEDRDQWTPPGERTCAEGDRGAVAVVELPLADDAHDRVSTFQSAPDD